MSTYHSPTKPAFERYLEKTRPKPDALLKRMQQDAGRDDVPVVSPDVGELLYLLTSMHRPRRIVECGTAIGMSTLHFARALRDFRIAGKVDTFDVSSERHAQATDYLRRDGLVRYVRFHTEPALAFLRHDKKPLDFLFIDAVKEEYAAYVRAALPRMKSGSVIVADNLLWHGYVPGARKPKAKFWKETTTALREFNGFFLRHPRLYARIFPVGDGTGVAVVR